MVEPAVAQDGDEALLEALAARLGSVYRAPTSVRFGRVLGANEGAVCVGEPDQRDRPRDPFAWLRFRRQPLVLNARHPLVKRARARFAESPELAVSILTRAVLVTARAMTEGRSEDLAEATVEALLAAAADDATSDAGASS